MNIYDSLCKVLSDRADQVDWEVFTAADWDAFGQRAVAEGVGPLIHWTLKRSNVERSTFNPSVVPRATADHLAKEYYQSAARNAVLFKELDRILAALDEAEIPVIVLKGAALARALYPDPALRPMRDLDLLVASRNLENTTKTIKQIGYQVRKISYHVVLEHDSLPGLTVEVHWGLFPEGGKGPSPSPEWFWEQTKLLHSTGEQPNSSNARHTGRYLSPTADVLYLVSHLAFQHGDTQGQLLWFYDIHAIVEQKNEPPDWDLLSDRACKYHWTAALSAILSDTWNYFRTPAIEHFMGSALLISATNDGSSPETSFEPLRTQTTRVWDAMRTTDARMRLALLRSLLFPTKIQILFRHKPRQAWLWPLYYPVRWMDIIHDMYLTLLNKLKNN